MTIIGEHSHPWVGIQANLRKEKVAAAHLEFKGYHVYLPLYQKRKRWSDRFVQSVCPVFPGYLFCRFDSTKPPILTTPGVVAVLGCNARPEPIPEHEIAAIETILQSGLPVAPYPYLREGDRITIMEGPLKGIDGMLVKSKNNFKVVVSVNLLQRSVAAEVDRDAIGLCSRVATSRALLPQSSHLYHRLLP
jgi:transcription antitermination factor NusG